MEHSIIFLNYYWRDLYPFLRKISPLLFHDILTLFHDHIVLKHSVHIDFKIEFPSQDLLLWNKINDTNKITLFHRPTTEHSSYCQFHNSHCHSWIPSALLSRTIWLYTKLSSTLQPSSTLAAAFLETLVIDRVRTLSPKSSSSTFKVHLQKNNFRLLLKAVVNYISIWIHVLKMII